MTSEYLPSRMPKYLKISSKYERRSSRPQKSFPSFCRKISILESMQDKRRKKEASFQDSSVKLWTELDEAR